MSEQLQKNRDSAKRSEVVDELTPTERNAAAQAKLAKTDALLDEIDALLEENAEEFVAAYVQKGGE